MLGNTPLADYSSVPQHEGQSWAQNGSEEARAVGRFPSPGRCGSDFWVYLSCGIFSPWFMIGRLAHRLNLPNAGWFSLGALFLTILSQILISSGIETKNVAAIIFGLVFISLLCLCTSFVRKAYRVSKNIPGTWSEDVYYSTPLVFCLPLYWCTDRLEMQCSNAMQLALMGVGTDSPPQIASPLEAEGGQTGQAKSGGPGDILVQPSPGKWSTDLFGCRCTKECEGDVVLCSCSIFWSWWMQTRIAKRIGKIDSFAKVACILFSLESLPDIWSLIADAAHLIGTTAEGVITFISYIPMTAFNYWLRLKVRERYSIQENFPCEDFLVSIFCYPCAIAQEDREITIRGDPVEV